MFASDSASCSSKAHIPQGPGSKDRIIPCLVNYCRGGRLQIIAAEALPAGSAIGVEHEDALLLGEVVANSAQSHVWKIEICVKQILNGLLNVMALRASWLDGSKPPVCPVAISPEEADQARLAIADSSR